MASDELRAAGMRLALTGAILGLLGVGIRLARPGDIGWGGVGAALVWGAACVAAGWASLRRLAWGPRAGAALLGLALLFLGALAWKAAAGPDRANALVGVGIVAAVLALTLAALVRHGVAESFFAKRRMAAACPSPPSPPVSKASSLPRRA